VNTEGEIVKIRKEPFLNVVRKTNLNQFSLKGTPTCASKYFNEVAFEYINMGSNETNYAFFAII